MTSDPDIDRFFQELKSAKSATSASDKFAPAETAKRIDILPEANGETVAVYKQLGKAVGEFRQTLSGEIYFSYRIDESRRWYVNKSMSAFRAAAAIFNRCCELHADDDNTDDEAAWASVVAQLQSEFEKIEPLDDPNTSLWSATIHDASGGLLTLY